MPVLSQRSGGYRSSNMIGRASRSGRAGFARAIPSTVGVFLPTDVSSTQLVSLDGTGVRYTNGTARLIDSSRAGTVRQMQPGRCWDLNGSTHSVNAGNVGDITTGDFTLSFWIYRDSAGTGARVIINKGAHTASSNGYRIELDASHNLNVYMGTGGSRTTVGTNTTALTADTWTHVAITFDRSGNCTFYLDGSADGTQDISSITGSLSNSDDFVIGTASNTPADYLDGKLFDVCLHGDLLSTSEISDMANMGPGTADGVPSDNLTIRYKA